MKVVEREFSLRLAIIFTNYHLFQGIYKLYYSHIQNGLMIPLTTPTGELSHYLNENTAFKIPIKSIVDIDKHGLFCESCCSPLRLLTREDTTCSTPCSRCKKYHVLKLICTEKRCGACYCMVCCKNVCIRRTKTRLLCFKEHELAFLH